MSHNRNLDHEDYGHVGNESGDSNNGDAGRQQMDQAPVAAYYPLAG